MFIAHKLKEESIAEYVIYMWYIEDMMRAYDCSLARISREYIPRYQCNDEEEEELRDWYGNIIRMMNQEGCRERGHLQINRTVVDDINDVHQFLLQSPRFPLYSAQYYKVLPYIVELRSKTDCPEGEIETCLSALYGSVILRLQGKEISTATNEALKELVTFINMLNEYYLKDKAEGLDGDE